MDQNPWRSSSMGSFMDFHTPGTPMKQAEEIVLELAIKSCEISSSQLKTAHDSCHLITWTSAKNKEQWNIITTYLTHSKKMIFCDDISRSRYPNITFYLSNILKVMDVVGSLTFLFFPRALTVEISNTDTRQTQLEMGVKAKVRMGDINCHGYVIVTSLDYPLVN
jgi:hypothetical protein